MNLASLEVTFQNSSGVCREQAICLLQEAFPFSTHAEEAERALLSSAHPGVNIFVVEVKQAGKLVGLAFAKQVTIRFDLITLKALTVGPLAVAPTSQGRGVGRVLMGGIDNLARSLSIEAVYLQGIPNFYQRFGYVPMLAKSKLIIELASIDYRYDTINVRHAVRADTQSLSSIYSALACGVSGAAFRDDACWHWLLGPAALSWYFQSPQVVELAGQPIGYFCVDRLSPVRVREFVGQTDPDAIWALMQGLKMHLENSGASHAEVMTWRESPLYNQSMFQMNAQFVEYGPMSGGQVIKLTDPESTVRAVLSARLGGVENDLIVESSGDLIIVTLGSEKAFVRLKSIVLWMLGVMPLESMISRGDISFDRKAKRSVTPQFLQLLRSSMGRVFVFQGDNL